MYNSNGFNKYFNYKNLNSSVPRPGVLTIEDSNSYIDMGIKFPELRSEINQLLKILDIL